MLQNVSFGEIRKDSSLRIETDLIIHSDFHIKLISTFANNSQQDPSFILFMQVQLDLSASK